MPNTPTPQSIQDLFGKVTPPPGTPQLVNDNPLTGLVKMMNVGLQIFMLIAGLYTLLNLILAGYMYITSSGDAKKVAEANQRITYTIIGLVIVAVAPLAAILIGVAVFHDPMAILNPTIKTINNQ